MELEEADGGGGTRAPAAGAVLYGPSPNLIYTLDSIYQKGKRAGTSTETFIKQLSRLNYH